MYDKAKTIIVVIALEQWGNTDFVNFAKQASINNLETFYIGLGRKDGLEHYPDREFVYEQYNSSKRLGFIGFVISVLRQLKRMFPDYKLFIHVRYFKGCFLIPLFFREKIVLDVRSASIKRNNYIRKAENKFLKAEASFFSEVSVISKDVACNVLGLSRFCTLPLGATLPNNTKRKACFSKPSHLKFVYVGVLTGRNLEVFCKAFGEFVIDKGLNWSLGIYGYGEKGDIIKIQEWARKYDFICWNGALLRENFYETLVRYDIGVCYVPITAYYNFQPPTKTFEYLAAGLPVLATCTEANKNVLDSSLGWLTGDDEAEIKQSLEAVLETEKLNLIPRSRLDGFTWRYIFNNHYIPLIRRVS